MKKSAYCIFVFLLTLSFLAVSVPGSVSAAAGDIGSGTWVTPGSAAAFTTVNVDKAAESAPDYLQQLSEGIMLSASAKICYPFRGGQFHWVPRIMRLTNAKWTAMTTEKESIFTDEAVEYACTKAPAAGTYALFGYYDGPAESDSAPAPLAKCGDDMVFTGEFMNNFNEGDPIVTIWLDKVPASLSGTTLKFELKGFASGGSVMLSPFTGTFEYNSVIDLYSYSFSRDSSVNVNSLSIQIDTPSCYKLVNLSAAPE